MVINFQDRNLIVSYLQLILKETFGVTLTTSDSSLNYSLDKSYEITMNQPVKVTGTYDLPTYFSLALYMAFNFPNEQYPYRLDFFNHEWVRFPYKPEELKNSINLIIENYLKGLWTWETVSTDYQEWYYNLPAEKKLKYLDWESLVRNFNSQDDLIDVCKGCLFEKRDFDNSDVRSCLVKILVANMKTSVTNYDALQVPERVLSYIFDEVVTPVSSNDEVFRAQKILYGERIPVGRVGIYDDQMIEDVKEIQTKFISRNTFTIDGSTKIQLPGGFEDFKVTGYVDPWTETIIKGGAQY